MLRNPVLAFGSYAKREIRRQGRQNLLRCCCWQPPFCVEFRVGLFGSRRHSSFHRASLAPQFQAKKTRSSVRRTVQKALLGLHERLFKEFEHMVRIAGALQHENMQLFQRVLMLFVVASREHSSPARSCHMLCFLKFTQPNVFSPLLSYQAGMKPSHGSSSPPAGISFPLCHFQCEETRRPVPLQNPVAKAPYLRFLIWVWEGSLPRLTPIH